MHTYSLAPGLESNNSVVPHGRAQSQAEAHRHRPRLQIGLLFQSAMTDERKLRAVWQKFITLRNLELPTNSPLPYSYEAFASKLRGNGHGEFSLEDLPTLCRAMREEGIDPTPILHTVLTACTPLRETCDGKLIDETLHLMRELGALASVADHGEIKSLTRSELRAALMTCGRLADLLAQAQHEIERAMR